MYVVLVILYTALFYLLQKHIIICNMPCTQIKYMDSYVNLDLQHCQDIRVEHHCNIVTSLRQNDTKAHVMQLLDHCSSMCGGRLNRVQYFNISC